LLSDARRNVRLYSRIKDRKSPIKGSRPSVPHGTNFFIYQLYFIQFFLHILLRIACWFAPSLFFDPVHL